MTSALRALLRAIAAVLATATVVAVYAIVLSRGSLL